ncbi:hypothetical protein HY095_06070 [Candidatus Micrarchaeota archaeon]|nr:hypothetical protein [Candidatus Micrarchaeota archaeon]
MDFNLLLNNRRVQIMLLVLAVALALIFVKGLNYGIEFVGGVRIPVTLEKSVGPQTMDLMVETIKTRINKFGLNQAIVRPVGDSEILVEIPKADSRVIANVERLLKEQGKFEAVIDGKVALAGSDVLQNAVGGSNNEAVTQPSGGGVSWELGFAASKEGADRFAAAAMGKAHYPVYMFLDRPSAAAIILERDWFNNTANPAEFQRAMSDVSRAQGDDIRIVYSDEFSSNFTPDLANVSQVIVAEGFEKRFPAIQSKLASLGFRPALAENATRRVINHTRLDMIPHAYVSDQGLTIINDWKAIGLISAPALSPGLAQGYVGQFYQITGTGKGATPQEQRFDAVSEIKLMKSVLSGGKLPVSTFIGSSYTIAPSLGAQFLSFSFLGIFLSALVVSILIVIRYQKLLLIVPIIFVNLVEVVSTLAIIGGFGTLDLAGMAGVITLIGTGIDDQIIITDEILHKRREGEEDEGEIPEKNVKERLGKAFQIILTTASVAIVTMLPLLLSGIVEITGFALAAIIGIAVGQLVTRPAFGVIIGELYGKGRK